MFVILISRLCLRPIATALGSDFVLHWYGLTVLEPGATPTLRGSIFIDRRPTIMGDHPAILAGSESRF